MRRRFYEVAVSAVGHLLSSCVAANWRGKIHAGCLDRGGKGIGKDKPESSCGSRACFAQSYHCSWTSSRSEERRVGKERGPAWPRSCRKKENGRSSQRSA